jgi:hypothetical protein
MSRLRNPRSTITALLTFFAVFLVVYLLLDSYFFFNITTTAKTLKQEQLARIWYHFSFQKIVRYCLFIFDSFGASQAVYINLWYKEAPLWKENLLIFGLICYFCPGSQKINILTAQYKRISNAQAVTSSDIF